MQARAPGGRYSFCALRRSIAFVKPLWTLLLLLGACNPENRAAAAPDPAPAPAPAAAKPAAATEAPKAEGTATSCGKEGMPDCPLQTWMKANLQAAVRAQDFERLGNGLDRLAAFAPPSMPEWAALAKAGAASARGHDMSKVREACGDCHDRYRGRYRAELRERPLATGTEAIR
jgi:hypothetical protein